MSASDKWGTQKKACPDCKGDVEWFHFAPDCRGNDISNGANCLGCKKTWDRIPKFVKHD